MKKAKPTMLYVGDFPAPTGFGIVSRNLINTFRKHYDISIIGVNYFGDYDPACEGLKVYPAGASQGDVFGFDKFGTLLYQNKPDVVFILNDIWIGGQYGAVIAKYKEDNPDATTKFMLYTPVDAENIKPDFVKAVHMFDHLITYTNFGKVELEKAGYTNKVWVIPHGVDKDNFKPIDKKKVRGIMGMPEDAFVVLNVSRNQPRKRLDLFFYIFSEFVKRNKLPETVKCYYHGALVDVGIDILQWVDFLGIKNHLALSSTDMTPINSLTLEQMNLVYNSADVFFTTAAAEGWGLPVSEAMAVGLPCILPNHSAFTDWPEDNAVLVDCYKFPTLTDRGLNTVHHVIDVDKAVAALEALYNSAELRKNLGKQGYDLMQQKRFNWDTIANSFMDILNG
jgi:glycosyltransferase involved in cell wall biosynthesis